MIFPQYAVSKWIGHSIAVSGKHYANDVPDELFDKATQKAKQQAAEVPGNGKQMKKPSEEGFLHNPAMGRDLTQVIAGQGLGGGGNRTPVPR